MYLRHPLCIEAECSQHQQSDIAPVPALLALKDMDLLATWYEVCGLFSLERIYTRI